jgi:hypothetical protein
MICWAICGSLANAQVGVSVAIAIANPTTTRRMGSLLRKIVTLQGLSLAVVHRLAAVNCIALG